MLVGRPEASGAAACSVDLAALYASALEQGLGACVLPPVWADAAGLTALVPGGVERRTAVGAAGVWIRVRAWAAERAAAWRRTRTGARATVWLEWQREMRRQAADDTLPGDVRVTLRDRAERAGDRARAATEPARRFPRSLLRLAVPTSLPPQLAEEARGALARAGVDLEAPRVVFDLRRAVDSIEPALARLRREGYALVRIGRATEPVRDHGVVDLSTADGAYGAPELGALLGAQFVIAQSVELQHVAYLTATPTLLLDATDPFSGYPVRADGRFTLATAVDLDSGQVLDLDARLDERYFRNLRNCGYRPTTADVVDGAVREMQAVAAGEVVEHPAQTAFRRRVTAAGEALAERLAFVATWGPHDGFIGDGRLARDQAERLLHPGRS